MRKRDGLSQADLDVQVQGAVIDPDQLDKLEPSIPMVFREIIHRANRNRERAFLLNGETNGQSVVYSAIPFFQRRRLPAEIGSLGERMRMGFRFGLFICFFSVVAELSDRFYVALPLSTFNQDFLRMAPYIIGVLVSGVVADLSGLL